MAAEHDDKRAEKPEDGEHANVQAGFDKQHNSLPDPLWREVVASAEASSERSPNHRVRQAVKSYWQRKRSKFARRAEQDAIKSVEKLAKRRPAGEVFRFRDPFHPAEAINILQSDTEAFQHQKIIAFTGLCAWIVAPKTNWIIRQSIQDCVGSLVAAIESHWMKTHPKLGDLAAIIAHLHEHNASLFSLHYGEKGAFDEDGSKLAPRAVRSLTNRYAPNIVDEVSDISDCCLTCIALMEFWNIHLNYRGVNIRAPSVDGYAALMSALSFRPHPIKSQTKYAVKDRWGNHSRSASFIYAAYKMKSDDGNLLFDILGYDGREVSKIPMTSHYRWISRFPELMRKAKYAENEIRRKMIIWEDDLPYQNLCCDISDVDVIAPVSIPPSDQALILEQFERKRTPRTAKPI